MESNLTDEGKHGPEWQEIRRGECLQDRSACIMEQDLVKQHGRTQALFETPRKRSPHVIRRLLP